MDQQDLQGPETAPVPPKPKRAKMVNVYNSSKRRSFHLGQGRKIGPGMTGKIPAAMYDKVKDTCSFLKRAERGDVV